MASPLHIDGYCAHSGRFCKPLDTELISKLAGEHSAMITVEEGSIGGFGSHGMPFVSPFAHFRLLPHSDIA